MTGDPLSWPQIAGLLTLVTAIILIGGVAVRQAVWTSRTEASAKAAQAIALEAKTEATIARDRADTASRDLASFRETVARDYASRDAISQIESRIMAAIERLGDRFDKYVDKGSH